ncbi:Tuftelin-interacting protein 11 [Nymphon striatum]|nr:Tuftelin-interacting protein 11 [Nymphon striatum]
MSRAEMEEAGVEVEDFVVSDYDLENALNPGRYRRRASKHQQIYGVWADESDEEVPRPSFGGGLGNTHVNFVSGGIKQSGETKNETEEENDVGNGGDIDKLVKTMAFKKFQSKTKKKPENFAGLHREVAGLKGSNERDFASWEKHTKGIGQKLLLQMGYQPGKGLGKTLQGISAPVEAKKRPGKGAIGMYGSERTKASLVHYPQEPTDEEETKTFRAKLQQWKKKPGEENKQKRKMKYIYKTVDEVKTDGISRKLFDSPGNNSGPVCQDKIIDMTGPQQRVLSGYQSLQHQHMKPDTSNSTEKNTVLPQKNVFEMPSLLYNIDMLIDMSEQEIIKNDRNLQHHRDMIISRNHQEENLDKLLISEKRQIIALEKIIEMIESVSLEKDQTDDLTPLQSVSDVFQKLQTDYYEEYRMFELSDLAVPLVFPLITKELEGWNPLQPGDNEIFKRFKEWKDILEESQTKNNFSNHKDGYLSDRYHRLIWDVWMPVLRKTVTNEWNVRECDPLIEFLETWMPIIPQWVMANILDQLVLPRLQNEVENWNPLTDTMPIHSWLHPWLPLMGERLGPLYAPIRHKLGNALVGWHPNDKSAKLILQPWVQVFSKGTLAAFVVKNILPKLIIVMQEFVINPHQQHLEPWHWVMDWEDFLPLPSIVTLLDKHFFPRWIQVLCTWLNSNPDYEEVTKWYRGWKSMFSDNLLTDPAIKNYFNRALEFLNRAISQPQRQNFNPPPANDMNQSQIPCPQQHMPVNNSSYYSPHQNVRNDMSMNYNGGSNFSNQLVRGASSARHAASASMNFKDLIAMKAEEHNLLFAPIPNRYYEGKQMYQFGRLMVHLDRNVVLFLNNENNLWMPTSIVNLISMT